MDSVFDWARWQRYFSDADVAQRWFESVPDPVAAADWYFMGVRDPIEAAEWIRLSETPKTLRAWRLSGFTDVSQILGWVRIGQSTEMAKRWIENGYGDPESAGEWASLVNGPESLLEWQRKGVESPQELNILCGQGLTLELVRGLDIKSAPTEGWKSWTQLTTQGQVADPEVINSWLLAHVPLSEAEKWIDVGATPLERDLLLSNDVSLEMLQKLKTSRCYELARNIRTQHQDLGKWIDHDFQFSEMMPWKQIGVSIEEVLDWQAVDVSPERARRFVILGFTPAEYVEHLTNPIMLESNLVRWERAGLPGRSVKVFVLGGIPDPEIARKWFDGFGKDPSRAVAQYRAYGGDYRRARAADRQAERIQLRSSYSPTSSLRQPAASLTPSAVRIPDASEEWLEEVVAWARTLQSSLRKLIQSPSVLSLDNLGMEIQIELNDDLIWGAVKVGSRRVRCAFDPESFDPFSAPASSEQRFVLGACICWFIDCSIVIPRMSRTTSTLYRQVNTDSGRASSGIRYVPTPTFSIKRVGRSADDHLGLKVRHQVSGHIRTLPAGHKGSNVARESAPRHIQRVMKTNETFVQPHFRGTEEQRRELETRLSRYSAVGEAISELDWS